MNRAIGLDRLASESDWDILVIGGGATGLGCAVDAATRGHKVALVEKGDFAQGTSSRSTKLVHGGVRYLKQGNLALVKGALRERGLLFKNAPHLVRPLSFVIPSYNWWERPYYATGLKFYDWLAGGLAINPAKVLSTTETLAEIPHLQEKNLHGGVMYWDGQFDDARLAIDLANTAWEYDGLVINYIEAKELIKENGKVRGAECIDTQNGITYTVKAKCVINATGVFSDHLRLSDNPRATPFIQASQGSHIVVSNTLLPLKSALIVPKTTDGRVLFAIPWLNRVIIGTTDTPMRDICEDPFPLKEEIEFIVENACQYLNVSLSRTDIKSAYAGLRPLVNLKSNVTSTAQISRDHHIEISDTGLLTIAGGKWTTYRKMAEDVIDKAQGAFSLPKKTCMTESLRIASAMPDPTGEWLHSDLPYTVEQLEHSIRLEMPICLDDVLSRRIRAMTLDQMATLEIAEKVADLMIKAKVMVESEKAAELETLRSKATRLAVV